MNILLKAYQDTVPNRLFLALIQTLDELELDTSSLLKTAGILTHSLNDERIPLDKAYLFTKTAIEKSGLQDLGLRFAKHACHFSIFGIIDYAAISSATLKEALDVILRYHQVMSIAQLKIDYQEKESTLLFEYPASPAMMQSFLEQAAIATLYLATTQFIDPKEDIIRINFMHPSPSNLTEYRKIFQCPFYFKQKQSGIVFKTQFLNAPWNYSDEKTSKLMTELCEQLITLPSDGDVIVYQIQQLLFNCRGHYPTLEQAAQKLHMSSRSLRRHLAKINTSYQKILNGIRETLAIRYLRISDLPLKKVAELLDFSDTRNFRRAFKQWTGKTPAEYRIRSDSV